MLIPARRIAIGVCALLLFVVAPCVPAAVSVSVLDANTVEADVVLSDGGGNTYSANVTITFDHAVNLSADSIGVSASLFDRTHPPGSLPPNVAFDPNFPMVITVEPPVMLFGNGYESGQVGDGNLAFFDTYEIEIHTGNLVCGSASSAYRLFKAEHGSSAFADVTDDLYQGSVRARGRGGAFSRFVIAADSRAPLLIALGKLANLQLRLTLASITNPALLANLTSLLGTVLVDLTLLIPDIDGALQALQTFIDDVTAAAGVSIANEWKSDRSLVNDAGELLSLAETLQFTLRLLQGGNPLCVPPPA